jgi:hypothetical protein
VGDIYEDKVIIHSSNQTKDFTAPTMKFVSLSKQTNDISPELQGIVGLGFNKNEINQNLVYNILLKGSRIFGVLINNSIFQLTFGNYDKAVIQEGSSSDGYGIHWFNLQGQSDSWAIELQDARYGYMSFHKGSADKAIFASGDRFIHVPKEDFDYLGGLWKSKFAIVNC